MAKITFYDSAHLITIEKCTELYISGTPVIFDEGRHVTFETPEE